MSTFALPLRANALLLSCIAIVRASNGDGGLAVKSTVPWHTCAGQCLLIALSVTCAGKVKSSCCAKVGKKESKELS